MTIETMTLANLEQFREVKLERLRTLHMMGCPFHSNSNLNEEYTQLTIDINTIDRLLGKKNGSVSSES